MTITSSKAFREEVLYQLSFQPSSQGHCTLYQNVSAPESLGIFYFIPVLVIMSLESQIIRYLRIFRSSLTIRNLF